MVIVDTSVWVDFLRQGDDRLNSWISADLVLQHPFVTAEIGMGSFRNSDDRTNVVDLLNSFLQVEACDCAEFHRFVGDNRLFGTGIGFADAHLLHACLQKPSKRLATRDRRLADQARAIGIEVV